jgi:two-component system, LytTR family, response regulator
MLDPTPIRCLVVDDEPPARDVLRRYISEMPLLYLAGECANAVEALALLQRQPIDLLFLDISMPQLKGTELLKILQHPPRVIFTTAHAEYALEGYELDAIDYLLKPIQFDRFLKAVNKAYSVAAPAAAFAYTQKEALKKEAFVYFRVERKMVKVMLDDILYAESMKDYIKVFTRQGTIVTKQSISSLEAMLPEDGFVRTHRSFIVSLSKVRSFTSELIEVDKAEIPIGKLFRQGVLRVLG